MERKLTWLKKVEKLVLMKLLSVIKLLIIVWKHEYIKCGKDTESINWRVSKTSNNITMILSKCEKYGSKKSRFIKNQEVKGLLSNLGIKTPISKVPLLGDILF